MTTAPSSESSGTKVTVDTPLAEFAKPGILRPSFSQARLAAGFPPVEVQVNWWAIPLRRPLKVPSMVGLSGGSVATKRGKPKVIEKRGKANF